VDRGAALRIFRGVTALESGPARAPEPVSSVQERLGGFAAWAQDENPAGNHYRNFLKAYLHAMVTGRKSPQRQSVGRHGCLRALPPDGRDGADEQSGHRLGLHCASQAAAEIAHARRSSLYCFAIGPFGEVCRCLCKVSRDHRASIDGRNGIVG